MRNAFVVGWKEFKTFFQTPIGWVILFFFTAIAGLMFFAAGHFFEIRRAELRMLFQWLPILFLFFAPAITMRLWAEERRSGTIETLLTLPLKDWEIAVGKYLAALGVIATYLVTLLPIAAVVCWFGDPDLGPIVGGFLGALLLGGAYAAIGAAASAVTENQIIAFVVSLVGSFVFYAIGYDLFISILPEALGGFFVALSLDTHFLAIARGVLDFRDLLYYVSFIATFLALNIWAVRRKPERLMTVGLTAVIALLANYLASGVAQRIDLTEDGRFTLSADTKRILSKLDDDLRLTAYLSSDLPADYASLRGDIEDLLSEFEAHAGGRLKVEVVDPDDGDEQKKAAEAAGIQPVQMNSAASDKLELKVAYLGLVIEYGNKTDKLPVVAGGDMLEYDLVRRVAKMARRAPLKIAWQVNDPFGGMQIPGMQRPPSQDRHSPSEDLREIDGALKAEYETTTVDLKSKVPDDVGVVVLCNAGAGLTDVQKFHLDQYLMRGGGLIVMAEGSEPMSFGGGMGGGSPYMRSAAQKLPDDFFDHFGFKLGKDLIVDLQCAQIPMRSGDSPFQVVMPYPAFPVAIADNIDQTHPLSARFSDVVFLFGSSLQFAPKPGVRAYELVKSSKQAKKLEGFIDVAHRKLIEELQSEEGARTYDSQFTLAGVLEGDFQSFFTARALPTEITEGKPADGDDHAGHDHGGGSPFGDLLDPGDTGSGGPRPPFDPTGALAPQDGAAPAETPAAPTASDDPAAAGAAAAGDGADAATAGDLATAPAVEKKEVEWLKSTTTPAKIVVIGTSEFVGPGLVGPRSGMRNDIFLQSAIDWIAAESLSGLRARRVMSSSFEEPSTTAKNMAYALGWFGMPLLLAAFGVFTLMWRSTIRPAAARRRMATLARS